MKSVLNFFRELVSEFSSPESKASFRLDIIANIVSITGVSIFVVMAKLFSDGLSLKEITAYFWVQGLTVTVFYFFVFLLALSLFNGLAAVFNEARKSLVRNEESSIVSKLIYFSSVILITLSTLNLYLEYGVRYFFQKL